MDKADQIAEARRKLLEKRLKAKRAGSGDRPEQATIPKFPNDRPIPATYGQQSLWYVQQIAPDSAVYNMANVVRITGNLNIEWLKQSIALVIARHEILRTNFIVVDGDLQQHVNAPHPPYFEIIPVEPHAVQDAIYTHIEAPFDLEQDALFRSILLQESDTSFVLLMVMHHIISDKWSLEVLIWREIATIYTALSAGETPDLPPVATQFKDFTGWQANKADSNAYQAKMAYWQDELANAPTLLQLPLDKQRPPRQQFDGEVLYHTLPASITEKLQQLSRDTGATVFMTLMAAYMLLLHRMSRDTDILVGTSVDLRTDASLEQTIGYFLNTVVLRQQFDTPMTFRDLLTVVKDRLLKAFSNQDVEFENLVQQLRPNRDASYNPIFQTMFVMWDANNTEPELPNLTLETIKLDPNIAKFDLTLYAQINTDNTLLLALEYATALFESETMQRLMSVYETLLDGIIGNPDARLDMLSWLPTVQEKTLLATWIQTAAAYPDNQQIHDLIASHDSEKIAIIHDDTHLTYGELNAKVNQLAHALIAAGVQQGHTVGIMVERSPEMLIGILAILKAGAAYVPIDPDYPDERIQFILDDSAIGILLTQSGITLAETALTRFNIDDDSVYEAYPDTPPITNSSPDDLAYIIYTSGSTGLPKGVRATHRNLVHSTTARFSVYEHPIERFLLLSSFAFDSSLVGIFWTLAGGGALCLPSHGAERDVVQIAGLIEQHGITHMLALPSLYSILLDFGASQDLSSLKTVIVAGESCPISLVETHFEQLPTTRLYNEYGPTEGTVWATVSEITADTEKVDIGRAIPNMQTYIVDEQLRPVPIGMIGELVIGGIGITQGYHQRPELTAERFVQNPFGNGRLYRTGDLARYLSDGHIEFLGRVDRQVKISGYRIEIGEIENALMAIKRVNDAVVVPHEINGLTQLVGFVIQEDSSNIDAIRKQLQTQLPHYMIPTRLIAIEAIPRTPNGKIDYDALIAQIPAIIETPYQARIVADDIEETLIGIWETMLGVSVSSTEASFFELGGHSLLAIRMFAEVNKAFDKNLPVSTIFEAPTITRLADILREDKIDDSTLITVKEGLADAIPIYCIQVNRFGVLQYQAFIDAMDAAYPIYGLVVPAARQDEELSLAEVANLFTDAIIQQKPTQPIVLLGLSLAGTVAYEVARLLVAHNIDATVFMVDTQGPDYPTHQPALQAMRQKAGLIFQDYRQSSLSNWGTITQQNLWVVRFRLRYQFHKRGNWVLAKLGLPLIYDKERHGLRMGGGDVKQMMRDYIKSNPISDDVQIVLYRGRLQPITSQHEWALGWDKLVPDEHITVEAVVGPHSALLKQPYLPQIIAHMRAWLRDRA